MKTTPKLLHPARSLLVAFVCGALLLVGGADAAGATSTGPTPTGNVRGVFGAVKDDGRCPVNPEFGGNEQHQQLAGLASTRFGPALLKLDLCYIFVGAIGGEELGGTFSLATLAGTLHGHVDGTVGFGATDHVTTTLTVERGSFLLSRIRGTLAFETSLPRESRVFTGTLTTSLHRS